MINNKSRQIITNTALGKRHLKEVLGSTFAGVILAPQEIWLVTAWISDFEVLDNRSGNWTYLNAGWGNRMITFLELLETAVLSGCKVNLVVKKSELNDTAINFLKTKLANEDNFRIEISDSLHIKGLLTETAFIKGSMNFTFSGANKNDELVTLSSDMHLISTARIDFKNLYFKNYQQPSNNSESSVIDIESDEHDEEDEYDFF